MEFSVAQTVFSTWVKAALGSGFPAMTTLQAITTNIGGICTAMLETLFLAFSQNWGAAFCVALFRLPSLDFACGIWGHAWGPPFSARFQRKIAPNCGNIAEAIPATGTR
jgi:hypothetical protein